MSTPYDEHQIAAKVKAIMEKNVANGWEVRVDIIETFLLWQEFGCVPGSFVQAILANDLAGACHKADRYNRSRIADIFCCLYNYFPAACHGSWEQLESWQKQFQSPEDKKEN